MSDLIRKNSTINLTELNQDLEKVDLLDQLDCSYKFQKGNLIDKFIVKGNADSVFYLDEHEKVYMLVCKITLCWNKNK